MLTNNNTKPIRACKEALEFLIKETAELAAGFEAFEMAAKAKGVCIDSGAMEDCRRMLSQMNRIAWRQMADLKHMQCMVISSKFAERTVEPFMSGINGRRA